MRFTETLKGSPETFFLLNTAILRISQEELLSGYAAQVRGSHTLTIGSDVNVCQLGRAEVMIEVPNWFLVVVCIGMFAAAYQRPKRTAFLIEGDQGPLLQSSLMQSQGMDSSPAEI